MAMNRNKIYAVICMTLSAAAIVTILVYLIKWFLWAFTRLTRLALHQETWSFRTSRREILSAGPPDENFLIRFRTAAHTPRATAAIVWTGAHQDDRKADDAARVGDRREDRVVAHHSTGCCGWLRGQHLIWKWYVKTVCGIEFLYLDMRNV